MNNNSVSGTYSFGAGTAALGDTDRAIGFLAAGGSVTSGNLYTELSNSTGNTLGGLQISYDVEKYRNGSNPWVPIQMFYSSDESTGQRRSNFLTPSLQMLITRLRHSAGAQSQLPTKR